MKFLDWADERLLALATRFCHFLQRLTGWSNFVIARLFLTGAVVSLGGHIIDVSSSNIAVLLKIIFIGVDTILAFVITLYAILAVMAESAKVGTRPFVQLIASKESRKWVLLTTPAFLWSNLDAVFKKPYDITSYTNCLATPAILAYLYCVSVTPLPPGYERIRLFGRVPQPVRVRG